MNFLFYRIILRYTKNILYVVPALIKRIRTCESIQHTSGNIGRKTMAIKMNYFNENAINIHVCQGTKSTPHTHDFLELAYVLHGTAVHEFNENEEEIISKGDYFIIDYHTAHSYQSVNNCDFAVINCLFLPQFVDKSLAYCRDFQTLLRHYLIKIGGEYSRPNLANRIFHDDDGKILDILRQMLCEYKEKHIGWSEVMRSKVIEVLILTARKLAFEEPQDIISNIMIQTHQNYNQKLTLGKLAAEMNYSLPYISKLFKEKKGMTFRAYLQKIRIDEACRLLANTDEKIANISKMVGYSDVDFFIKVFKASTGTTPQQFRLQLKMQNR